MTKKLSANTLYNPTGTIIPVTGEVPEGYLACDGSEVSITQYQKLYDVLTNNGGTNPYGSATSGNFKLPDLRGRVPTGASQSSLGQTDGAENSDASQISVAAIGTHESNYSSTADFNVSVGNLACSGAANTSEHQISSGNMPAHTHSVISSVNTQISGNTSINGLNRRNRNTATSIRFGRTQNGQLNVWTARSNGNGTKVNRQGNVNQRWRGQSSGDGGNIGKQGNTLRANDWANVNNNVIIWREMRGRSIRRSHRHSVSNLMQSSTNAIGNVAAARNSTGTVNFNTSDSNFSMGNDITVNYGNLEGKQVLVLYAIKY